MKMKTLAALLCFVAMLAACDTETPQAPEPVIVEVETFLTKRCL